MENNSWTCWCHLRCLPQVFFREQDPYLYFRVLLFKSPFKKISRNTFIRKIYFHCFLLPKGSVYWTYWSRSALSMFCPYISLASYNKQGKNWQYLHVTRLCSIKCVLIILQQIEVFLIFTKQAALILYESNLSTTENVCLVDWKLANGVWQPNVKFCWQTFKLWQHFWRFLDLHSREESGRSSTLTGRGHSGISVVYSAKSISTELRGVSSECQGLLENAKFRIFVVTQGWHNLTFNMNKSKTAACSR